VKVTPLFYPGSPV